MKEPTVRDEKFEIWWLWLQTENAMSNARAKELSRFGLTTAEAALLFAVYTLNNQARPVDLAVWLHRKRHTITSILTRMERLGRVRRVKDRQNSNVKRIVLTEEGNHLLSYAMKRDSIHRMLGCLSNEEQHQLKKILFSLRDKAFEETGVNRKPPYPPSS
jgi:DNA-binding MarR family transcriptional regulator